MATAVEILTEATRPSQRECAWCRSAPHAGFVVDVLRSADDEGVIRASWGNLAALSMMTGMLVVGWIDRVNSGRNTPLAPFRITQEGRRVLDLAQAQS